MAKSFVAIAALMLFAVTTLNLKRADATVYRYAKQVEAERLARRAADRVLADLATKPFDAHTRNRLVTADHPRLDLLTPAAAFGSAPRLQAARDVDDVHGVRADTVWVTGSSGQEVAFLVDADVYYVDDAGYIAATPTAAKEVSLSVTGPLGSPSMQRLHEPFIHARRFDLGW